MNYIALLRGINVGGNKLVPMAALRELSASLGHRDPRTYVQSGNLVFGAETRANGDLESELEEAIERSIKVRCDVMIRSTDEWRSLVAGNPFKVEAQSDPGHLVVQVLKHPVPAEAIEALKAANPGREEMHLAGGHLYVTFPDGMGESKLANSLLSKYVKAPATARNWNTVLKIAAMLETWAG